MQRSGLPNLIAATLKPVVHGLDENAVAIIHEKATYRLDMRRKLASVIEQWEDSHSLPEAVSLLSAFDIVLK